MTAHSPDIDVDVAIVGCGPVGALAANFLGLQGYETVILEKRNEFFPFPRAVAMDSEIQRTFQNVGLGEEIQEHTDAASVYSFTDSAKRPMFTFETVDSTPSGYPSLNMFPQPELEAELRGGFDRFDHVDLKLGHEVTEVSQDSEEVTTKVTDHIDGTTKTVRSKYVIGSDGGKSNIRRTISDGFKSWDYGENHSWVVIDTKVEDISKAPDPVGFHDIRYNDRPPAWQYSQPERPFSMIPVVGDHYRVEFAVTDEESMEDFDDDEERVREVILDHIGDFGFNIFRIATYSHNSIIADNWRDGRILIAGDAAHQMPPFAGRGMAEGIRDVENLTWKLHLVLSGQASPELLESYQEERAPIAEDAIKLSMRLGYVVDIQTPWKATIRNAVFRALNSIPPISDNLQSLVPPQTVLQSGLYSGDFTGEPSEVTAPSLLNRLPGGIKRSLPDPLQTGDAAAKHRFPQTEVQTPDQGNKRLDDLIGTGNFGIIGWNWDPQKLLDNSTLSVLERLPITFVMLTSQQSDLDDIDTDTLVVHDSDGKFEDWFGNHRGDIALVRPDRYTYGMATTARYPHLVQEFIEDIPVAEPDPDSAGELESELVSN